MCQGVKKPFLFVALLKKIKKMYIMEKKVCQEMKQKKTRIFKKKWSNVLCYF